MRSIMLAAFILLLGISVIQAKPTKKDSKEEPTSPKQKSATFKPIDINKELDANDPKDEMTNNPSQRHTVKLAKGKSYAIDLVSTDFDAFLRLLDKDGKELAADDDSGGDLNSRILHSADRDGDYIIVVTSFDGQVGKFSLKVREFAFKGEAKPRDVGKNGITINGQINQNDKSPLGKRGILYTVQLKKGQTYQIDLSSQAFDSYLYLFDAKGKILAQDDDGGGNLDSRITYRAEADGVFHILASSLDGNETGDFTVTVTPKGD
ncbi:MAG TPA: PPC domain-containing protein [Gemmataceae bacterium]|nr:PPC domain-containing protein [Gemmataceae bacterium]